eukprot:4810097-Pleurochrysis_carterae.AAC.1
MHEFLARKDENGDVRIYLRRSSQSSFWFPDGPGYKIFSTPPNGIPELAMAKPDARWSRTTVESTVRS